MGFHGEMTLDRVIQYGPEMTHHLHRRLDKARILQHHALQNKLAGMGPRRIDLEKVDWDELSVKDTQKSVMGLGFRFIEFTILEVPEDSDSVSEFCPLPQVKRDILDTLPFRDIY